MNSTAHTGTAISDRTPGTIWADIRDPARWPVWNSSVSRLVLDGPFAAGTTGQLTPPGGNPLPFKLVAVDDGRGYTSETEIASTVKLRSSTAFDVSAGKTVITQHSELTGPAAEHFAESFADELVRGVETTVVRLANGSI